MTTSSLLIARLRTCGVSLHSDGTRLIVDAPTGVITSELRDQMVLLKPDILSELAAEALGIDPDAAAKKAIVNIAVLLATAYRRSNSVPRVGKIPHRDSGADELANFSDTSVHGVVP